MWPMKTSDFRTSNWKACSMIGRSRNLMLIAGLWLPTGMRMSRTRSCMERAPSTTRMNDAQRFPLAAKSGLEQARRARSHYVEAGGAALLSALDSRAPASEKLVQRLGGGLGQNNTSRKGQRCGL